MGAPATYRGVINHYKKCPQEIQDYFSAFPKLAEEHDWEVSLSYQFGLVERAHNMALYCGVVKLHQVDAGLARQAIEAQHITREYFRELFKTIFGKHVRKPIAEKLNSASSIRDKVLHGKTANPSEMRHAVVDVLNYATEFNDFVHSIGGFRPFGPLSGFKGRAKPLPKSTSRWVLKGVGFNGV